MRVGERVARPDVGVVHAVKEHVHFAKRPCLRVVFLSVEMGFAAGDFRVGLQEQSAATAGGVIDTVIFTRLYQRGDEFGNLAGREKFAALLPGVRRELRNHVFVGVADDVGGTELRGTQVKPVKIFQQIAQGGVFGFHVAEIHVGVEVNRPKDVAEFAAVALLNLRQSHVDFLPDGVVVAVRVEVIKRRFRIHFFAAHGAFHAFRIPVVLPLIRGAAFLGHVTEVLDEQHGQNVVLIAGTVDFTAKAVAGFPQNALYIGFGCHGRFSFFKDSWSFSVRDA